MSTEPKKMVINNILRPAHMKQAPVPPKGIKKILLQLRSFFMPNKQNKRTPPRRRHARP